MASGYIQSILDICYWELFKGFELRNIIGFSSLACERVIHFLDWDHLDDLDLDMVTGL